MIMVARLRLLLQVVTPPIRKRKLPFQLQQGHFQRFAHLIIGIQSVKRSQEILIVLWMEPIDLLDSMLIEYLMRVRSLFILLFMRFQYYSKNIRDTYSKYFFLMNLECLSSEDCANNEYCNTAVNLCQDACSLNGK